MDEAARRGGSNKQAAITLKPLPGGFIQEEALYTFFP
jgi:hypothetical protein